MCNYPENDVNEIIPDLWLGNVKSAYNKSFLEKYKIKNVLTVMDDFDIDNRSQDITYFVIPIKDKHSCTIDMTEAFDMGTLFIYNSLLHNQPVLVHCKRGHHRSAAIVAAFLIKYLKIKYLTALYYINYLRPCAIRRDTCMMNHLFKYYLHVNNIKHCNVQCSIENKIYSCKCIS